MRSSRNRGLARLSSEVEARLLTMRHGDVYEYYTECHVAILTSRICLHG